MSSDKLRSAMHTQSLYDLVAKYGDYSSSFVALEPHFSLWQPNKDEGVAYVRVRGAWVAAGPPLSHPQRQREVAQAFIEAARSHRSQAVFFGLNPTQVVQLGLPSLVIGEEPLFHLSQWCRDAPQLRTLRSQVRRAARAGVVAQKVDEHLLRPGSQLRIALDRLAARWNALHAMPPMGFVVALHPFDQASLRQIWVAHCCGMPVAFASAAPYRDGAGWFIEDIIRTREAPNGATELLIDAVITALRLQGAQEVSLGMIPLAGQVFWGLHVVRRLGRSLYNFAGLHAFKHKLHPTGVVPVALCWGPAPNVLQRIQQPVWVLIAVLRAFAHGSLVLFCWRTLLRGPRPVLICMVVALIPWTLILVTLDAQVWFYRPWIQHAWAVFDIILWLGLALLVCRPRRRLRLFLALATAADACMTCAEVISYREPHGLFPSLVRLAAVAAPALASLVLWGSWMRLKVMVGPPHTVQNLNFIGDLDPQKKSHIPQ